MFAIHRNEDTRPCLSSVLVRDIWFDLTVFLVGTLGTVGTSLQTLAQKCPRVDLPESGQSGQSTPAEWRSRSQCVVALGVTPELAAASFTTQRTRERSRGLPDRELNAGSSGPHASRRLKRSSAIRFGNGIVRGCLPLPVTVICTKSKCTWISHQWSRHASDTRSPVP